MVKFLYSGTFISNLFLRIESFALANEDDDGNVGDELLVRIMILEIKVIVNKMFYFDIFCIYLIIN